MCGRGFWDTSPVASGGDPRVPGRGPPWPCRGFRVIRARAEGGVQHQVLPSPSRGDPRARGRGAAGGSPLRACRVIRACAEGGRRCLSACRRTGDPRVRGRGLGSLGDSKFGVIRARAEGGAEGGVQHQVLPSPSRGDPRARGRGAAGGSPLRACRVIRACAEGGRRCLSACRRTGDPRVRGRGLGSLGDSKFGVIRARAEGGAAGDIAARLHAGDPRSRGRGHHESEDRRARDPRPRGRGLFAQRDGKPRVIRACAEGGLISRRAAVPRRLCFGATR